MFPVPSSLLLSDYVPVVEILLKSLKIEYKKLLSCRPSHLDHEKSGKSTTSFNQEFIKTLAILRVHKDFCGI